MSTVPSALRYASLGQSRPVSTGRRGNGGDAGNVYCTCSNPLLTLSPVKMAAAALSAGKSVVIDNTNPSASKRAEWIALAKKHKVGPFLGFACLP